MNTNPATRKIINDPVYGFITVDHPLVLAVVSHPYYQRLRNIHQMAFAYLVYPGAMHSRMHHSLGAYHLMGIALHELRSKGIDISPEEELGAKLAILLHDCGHGPFSHALEKELIPGVHHEQLSLLIMEKLNEEFQGKLDMAIAIFTNQYPKKFLHQLVTGQLDVDRLDYLNRDSFFTGVAEGVIGYDRILKMLTVHQGQLMVEEKAIFSTEKFLISRRLMYWQVYLHKTVVSAEMTLVHALRRAQELIGKGIAVKAATAALDFFLQNQQAAAAIKQHLDLFCRLDDHDVMASIKNWCDHPDRVLAQLSKLIVNRQLLKIRFTPNTSSSSTLDALRKEAAIKLEITEQEAAYFVFTGEASNTTYNPKDERIQILFKDGQVKDISEVDHALINYGNSISYGEIKKHFVCYPGTLKTTPY
ncbi:MAG: HD domain-containing protein [Bacteroidetes bacterium]|nr:HD domain-containing protein [Bacteroidota bacterium]